MSKEIDKSRKRLSFDAPKRPPKSVSLQSKNDVIMDKPLFSEEQKRKKEESFTVSDDEEYSECVICKKVLSNLSLERRILHINGCLDKEETEKKKKEAEEKYKNTVDCPICHTPFPLGPHRTAHLKLCAKRNNISGDMLIKMENTQQKITKVNKSNGLTHTKAPPPKVKPVAPKKLHGQPTTFNQEQIQMATAISNSLRKSPQKTNIQDFMQSTPEFRKVSDPNENRRKRPKSFALVEFAPRTCQCHVITTIQSRFVDAFKSAVNPSKNPENKLSSFGTSHAKYERRLVEKASRYEGVANDFAALLDRGEGADIHINCNDGVIGAHKAILMARSIGFIEKGKDTYQISEAKEIVMSWLKFLYTGRVEWSPNQEEAIHELGKKYGPTSILFTKAQGKIFIYEKDVIQPSTSTVPSMFENPAETFENFSFMPSERVDPIILNQSQTSQNVENRLEEDTICGVLNSTEPNDGENPLQGVFNNQSINEQKKKVNETSNSQRRIEQSDNIEIINLSDGSGKIESYGEKFDENKMTRDDGSTSSKDLFEEKSSDESYEPWHMTPVVFVDPADETTETEDKLETVEIISKEKTVENQEPEPSGFQDISSYPYVEEFNNFEDYYEPYDDIYLPVEQQSSSNSFLKPTTSKDNIHEDLITEKSHRLSSVANDFSPPKTNKSDSFDNTLEFLPMNASIPQDSDPLATSTPLKPIVKKMQFASNIKILKTVGITPMPNYNQMDDGQLKNELARFGLRPMARKRAVKKLEEIYECTHPEIDVTTPTIRPLNRNLPGVKEVEEIESPARKKSRLPNFRQNFNTGSVSSVSEVSDVDSEEKSEGNGNKTLNSELDEPAEETLLDDAATLPKNLKEMTSTFLKWVRKSENEHLYTHMLGLQPVLLDELHMKMSRANDPVCGIPKNSLATILENLGITFSLPVTTRGRGKLAARGKARHKK